MASSSESIEALYSEAYALVEQGICYDEVGQRDGALAMYERGLQLIDRAGQMPGAEGNSLYQKMVAARDHVLYRLKDLRSSDAPDPTGRPSSLPRPPTSPYEALEGTIHAFGDSKSAEEIFMIQGGCQIFQILGEETSVPGYPSSLRIFRFAPDSPADGGVPAFLQVGDWVYPLLPGRSPVLSTDYGAYIFPNPTHEDPDLFVGLLLPSDLEPGERGNFEELLRGLTEMRQSSVDSTDALSHDENQRLAAKVSRLLVEGGQALAWGVKKGQEFTSSFINKEADKAIQRRPANSQPKYIDPRVQTSVHYLRRGTKVAVKVSGYLVNKVGELASKIGGSVASAATKRVGGPSSASGRLLGDAVEVVKGGVAGVATVYMGMEDAAKTLAKDIANDTVRFVHHAYGEPLARVTEDGMKAVGHGGMAAWNVTELGPKSIAKRTAKKAGLAIINDMGGGEPSSSKTAKPERPPPPNTE